MKSRRVRWAGYAACMRGEKSVQGFDGKARWKETTLKTEEQTGGWGQNGS
jgi:hypothetical protein